MFALDSPLDAYFVVIGSCPAILYQVPKSDILKRSEVEPGVAALLPQWSQWAMETFEKCGLF